MQPIFPLAETVSNNEMHLKEMKKQLDNVQKSLDTVVQYIEQEKSREHCHSEPAGTSLQKVKKNVHGRNQQKLHPSILCCYKNSSTIELFLPVPVCLNMLVYMCVSEYCIGKIIAHLVSHFYVSFKKLSGFPL